MKISLTLSTLSGFQFQGWFSHSESPEDGQQQESASEGSGGGEHAEDEAVHCDQAGGDTGAQNSQGEVRGAGDEASLET